MRDLNKQLHKRLSGLRVWFAGRLVRFWIYRRKKYPSRTGMNFDGRQPRPEGGEYLPTLITFGTADSIYAARMKELERAVEQTGNSIYAELFAKGHPNFIRRLKPQFIKLKLLALKRPVLWIDCDSNISNTIWLPEGEWDIGTISLTTDVQGSRIRAADCVAFQPTSRVVKFLETWEFLCALDRGGGSDHLYMHEALRLLRNDLVELDIKNYVDKSFLRGKLGGAPSKL